MNKIDAQMMGMIAHSAIICPARHIVLEFNFILICVNTVHLWLNFFSSGNRFGLILLKVVTLRGTDARRQTLRFSKNLRYSSE